MKAVIMAGGKGTRLRPLTSNTPKPMVPLLNKPCMEYSIELLKKYGITEIAVTVQYMPEVIKNYFGDGSDYGVHIRYFEESIPLGTAGSVKNAEEFLTETFIVISGDALTDYNLAEAIHFHEQKKAIATLVLTQVDSPLEYGVVMTDDEGRIKRFLEKPSWSEVFSDTVNTGIYIFEPEIFSYYEKGVEFDFSKDLFPLFLQEQRPLYGFVARGYWSDIGNLAMYRQTQFDMLDGLVDVMLRGKEVAPKVFVERWVDIQSNVKITGPAYIGENSALISGSMIGPYTVMGKRNVINRGSVLQKTILWEGNYIEQQVEAQGVTVCNHTKIGQCSSFFEGAVIGDKCKIGAKSFVKEGVKIWPRKIIDEGSTVHSSLIWGEKQSNRLFTDQGIQGIANVDITPDFMSQLGAAYGSVVHSGANISLSSCSHPFANLMKQALMAGLISAGIDIIDFGATMAPVARYGVQQLGITGGVHIVMEEPLVLNRMFIEFYDQDGIYLGPELQRKIENAFWQEDFRRSPCEAIGMNHLYPQVVDQYIEGLYQAIQAEKVKEKQFKVVVEHHSSPIQHIILSILNRLSCKVISISREEQQDHLELIRYVKQNQADIGISMDKNGQDFHLITEQGKIIERNMLYAFQLLIHDQEKQRFVLGIPNSAPSVLDHLATELEVTVIRTKENPRSMMEVTKGASFHPMFDALYTLVKTMEYMSIRDTCLSEVDAMVPHFHIVNEAVFCPWTEKGKVMRLMMEEMKGKEIELLDGIKLYSNQGWVLILPDQEKPSFRVISQAASTEVASILAQTFAERIRKFQVQSFSI